MIRSGLFALLCAVPALILFAPAAAAQSGTGGISGFVLAFDTDNNITFTGEWDHGIHADDTEHVAGPTVTLIPVATLQPVEAQQQVAEDYTFMYMPMGLYLLRAEAPGYQTWEAEIYISSDTMSKVFIPLRPEE